MNKKILTTLILFILGFQQFTASNRYWIASSSSNWNNTANWSTSSGGLGGASIPTTTDQVFFDGNGLGNSTIDIAVIIESIQLNSTYTGIIDLNGNSFLVSGINNNLFAGGTINDASGTSTFSLTSTGSTTFSGTSFGSRINASSGRLFLNGSTFNNIVTFTKTGANSDASSGGNNFLMDASFTNNGSGYFRLGNVNADIFSANVSLTNTGTNNMSIARNGLGHSIAGDLTITHSASGPVDSRMYAAHGSNSSLSITGNVIIVQNGNATGLRTYFGDQGDITVGGNISVTNSGSGTTSEIFLANNTNSSLLANGNTHVSNENTATTTNRIYLGNLGDITFNGTLDIVNNSGVTNSEIYCNHNVNSVNFYNESITVSSTNAASDGVLFGRDNGTGTLAATKTITIPGVDVANFIGGQLYFRNFMQVGATSQTLELGPTATYIYNYDSDWGGDVDFRAPRHRTRGTTYNGTVILHKSGGIGDDRSVGGNTFMGTTTIVNSGSRSFHLGDGTADVFQSDLDLINTGSNGIAVAWNGPGHTIGGNLSITHSASGTTDNRAYISNGSSATLAITGNVNIVQDGSASTLRTYLGEQGDVIIGGDVTITNAGTGTTSDIYIANNTNSSMVINGTASVINENTATTTNRIYLGNQGDITFNGTLDIVNNSGVTNSPIYCNHQSNSLNIYNENVTVSSTNTNSDGILFGSSTGTGTLAATKTITIPGVDTTNFIGGQLYFRNFAQIGNTPHSFELGSTATFIYNYDCNWGGNVDFRAPRHITRGTIYNGTAYLEKTGGIGDDQSAGGNTFVGDATLINSGAEYFLFGNGAPDIFQGNVDITNSGSDNFFLAFNSLGNSIAGNLNITNSATGSGGYAIYVSDRVGSSLNVSGDVVLVQNGNGNALRTYFADDGNVNVTGNLTAINAGTGATSEIRLAQNTTSLLDLTGNLIVTNSSVGGTTQNSYIGEQGDINIGGTLAVNNLSSATSGLVLVANNTNSSVVISGISTISNTGAGITKRVFLGNQGDVTFNGALDIINSASASNSEVFCNHNINSVNVYNENITVSSTNSASDGIFFGQANGSGTLATSKTISIPGIDVTNFIGGQLYFRNFTQIGNTSHSLELGPTATFIYNYDSNWGGNVDFRAPRNFTRGTTYNGTTELHKTGGIGEDYSSGGNIFIDNATFVNSGTRGFYFGNGTFDTFQANVDLINNSSNGIGIAWNGAGHTIAGNLNITNSASGTTDNRAYASTGNTATLAVTGNVNIVQNGSSTTLRTYLGDQGDVTVGGNVTATNAGTGNTSEVYLANNTSSLLIVNGNTSVINENTAASTNRIYLGNQGDITFNGTLDILNNSGVTNSQVYCNHNVNSVNTYNDDITVSSTNTASDGIFFGQANGSGTLAATKTVSIPGVDVINFIGGQMYFRNFTQVGATSQALELGPTATYIYNYDSNWGGDIDFRGPRHFTRGTTYNGTTVLHKTGGIGDDRLSGGNTFLGNSTIVNSGTRIFYFGDGTADDFQMNVDLINTGTNNVAVAWNGLGHTIAGDLNITNSASGTTDNRAYAAQNTASSLSITGNVNIIQDGSATTLRTYLGDQGDIIIGGNIVASNSGTGTTSEIYLANNTNSSLLVSGNTTVTNENTATTTNRIYLGNQGDITFNGTLDIINNSGVTNSEVYCNFNVNSVNIYNENITVSSANTTSDGILFGSANGTGILAATKTITIPGVDTTNFIGGQLYFRNFTQTGATDHAFELGATATFVYNYDSNWGGNVDFRGPRHITRGTIYSGTARLEKTGGIGDDPSFGGNTFVGDATLINSGTRYFMFGNGAADDFQANVDITNSGSHNFYLAYNSLGNAIAGNLNITNSATGTGDYRVYITDRTSSSLVIAGDVTLVQNGNGNILRFYFGDDGDVNISGNLTVTNAGTGTLSEIRLAQASTALLDLTGNLTATNSTVGGNSQNIYFGEQGDINIGGFLNINNLSSATVGQIVLANNTSSSVVISGNSTVSNSGSGTTKRIFLGNQGDVTFNGTLDITNSASATNSEVYCNYNANSSNIYNDDITVSATNTASDGILFGRNNGSGTLTATKTITIPGVDVTNFIGGQLYFRNFTQTGNTSQSLELGPTATYIYNYDSNWGGDIDFRAPRNFTRGTTYNGIATMHKTGGIGEDYGSGGNIFAGNAIFINSGTRGFYFGNGTFDDFQANVDLINIGSNGIGIAWNGPGHTIAGDLNITNSATGTTDNRVYASTGSGATLTVNGNVNILQNGSSTTLRTYLGERGDVTVEGNITASNSGTGTTSEIYFGNNTISNIIINGNTSVTNENTAATTNRIYLGNQGDIVFNGTLDIINNSGVTNSEVLLNFNVNSTNLYNENITLTSTHALSDGIRFGQNNGTGTLAATKTIAIGGGGYVANLLYLRNFIQTGNTPQTLQTNGVTLFTNYDSEWNGNVDFRSPRHVTRGTTYNGTAFLEKNGANNDVSLGGNIFNNDITFQNTGSGYFMPSNTTGNDFNANVTYINTGTNVIRPTNNSTSTYAGNITIEASYSMRFGQDNNGRVIFDGTTAQSINTVGATPTPEFRDLQTNNLNNDVTLNTPITIRSVLDLDNGHIISDATNLLIMNDNAIVSSASESAFVSGPVRKIGNEAFEFPIGKNDTAYAPISISAPSNTSHHFTAEYIQINPDSVTPTPYSRSLHDPTLNRVSGCEYWILDRTNGASNVNVTLSWDDRSCGVTNLSELRVARWDGTQWKDHGNGATTGNTNNGTVVSSAAVTSFSPFTLGSTTINNPLPITLINFEAILNDDQVDLFWSTASEINNDFFTLEKSTDGINWIAFEEQPGAGNSNTILNYSAIDYSPYNNISYYRLKQTDFNGEFAYSDIAIINNSKLSIISAYPNPVKDFLNISNMDNNSIVRIFASDGKIIYSGGSNRINTENWGHGVYQMIVSNANGEIISRLRIVK